MRKFDRNATPLLRKLRKPGFLHLIPPVALALMMSMPAAAENAQVRRNLDAGNFETAYQLLLEELDRNPNDENDIYLLGLAASNGSRSSIFLKEYLQKFPRGPHATSARRRLLDYYDSAGLEITAGRLFDDDLDSASPDDIYRSAVIKQQLGQLDDASRLFERAGKIADDELAGWCLLGRADCELLGNDHGRAEKRYKEYIDKFTDSPSYPFALIGLSETYRRMGDLDRAATYYQLYRERYESAPGSDEIKAAILEGNSGPPRGNLPSILDVDFFIQVGVFAKEDNAKRCVREFRNSGFRSKMEEFDQDGKSFYRALIGPFPNENEARRQKQQLEKSRGEEYLIILR